MKDLWYAVTVILGMTVIIGGVFIFGCFVAWIVVLIKDDIKHGRKS